MKFYFSYGTNLDSGAMLLRCPAALLAGPAELEGWALTFGASGWPTIRPQAAASVEGLLWIVGDECLDALDVYEDVQSGLYTRASLRVRDRPGTTFDAQVYIEASFEEGPPLPGLIERLALLAAEAGLPSALAALERLQEEHGTGGELRDQGSGRFNRE